MLAIALSIFATPLPLPPQPMQVQVVRDRITDHIRAYATAREDGNVLAVSCDTSDNDGPRVSFHARRYLRPGHFLLGGDRSVTYRFDNLPPQRMMWDVEERRGLLTDRDDVATFLAGLADARQLVIRARDIENDRFDIVFQLRDAGPAIAEALAACGRAAA